MGIKAFLLASSDTGYVYRMKIYAGKEKSNIKGLVENMLQNLEENAHIVYMDNYYTSIDLLRSLRKKKIRCTGTLRKNRIKNVELAHKFSKEHKGSIKFYTNAPHLDLNLLTWKDAREVFMLSNHRDSSIEEVEIKQNETIVYKKVPTMRQYYNKKCRGVDHANQCCNNYRYNHKQYKWWKPIFDEIIQITFSNLYIIHKYLSNSPMKRLDFFLKIIKFLIFEEVIERPLPTIIHYLDYVPLKKLNLQRNNENIAEEAVIGKKDFRLNCKVLNCKKKTEFHCVGCSKINFICALCVPDCFIKYHNISS